MTQQAEVQWLMIKLAAEACSGHVAGDAYCLEADIWIQLLVIMRCTPSHRAAAPLKPAPPAVAGVDGHASVGRPHGASTPYGCQHRVPPHRLPKLAAADDADSTAQTFLDSLRDIPPSQVRRCILFNTRRCPWCQARRCLRRHDARPAT